MPNDTANFKNSYKSASKNSMFKSKEIKQYLTYNSGSNKSKSFNFEVERKKPQPTKYFINLSNCKDNKGAIINSESSLNSRNMINNRNNSSNKDKIILALRYIKFQRSSLDHQRYCFEKLFKSKARNFCLQVAFDKRNILVNHLLLIL